MKKHFLCFYLVVLTSFHVFAQTTISVSKHYQEHFELSEEEAVFVHVNKTSYLAGEEIWFKGYIFNKRNEKTSDVSTNLYVGLYDENDKQLSKKLVRIRQGKAYGNIALDKDMDSGTYYIKAATQQMVDESSEEAFVEEIVIYGTRILPQEMKNENSEKYDIQFLPEGGYIVKNIKNNIAFKAIDDKGKGVYTTGIIYDENDNEITTFESNHFGIGTFQLSPEAAHSYNAKIIFREKDTIKKQLPKVEDTGIGIYVDNMEKDTIKISLNTNSKTLQQIVSKEYTLLIHKDGLVRSMPFSFKNNKKVDLLIARNNLFNGVNTITLFDGKTPILERMFFNRRVTKELSVIAEKISTEGDFSKFSLYLIKNKSNIREANVSISVLPKTTEAYDPAHNIFSSFYLKPYVRGEIEDPKYYFPNKTKTQKEALDALLITQGWSKYDWNSIFQGPPKKSIASKGMTIKGTVNSPTKNVKGILLHDTKELPAQYISVDKKRNFVIYNMYPEAGEKLRFSYINRKKEFLKPKLYLRYNISKEKDNIAENFTIDRSFLNSTNMFTIPDDFFPKDAEILNTVVLNASNKDKKKFLRDPMMVNGRETKIGIKEYMTYPRIGIFLQNNGYNVVEDLSLGRVSVTTKRPKTLIGQPTGRAKPRPDTPSSGATLLNLHSAESGQTGIEPLIFIDNVPLSSFDILFSFSMANVERIVIDKTGLGYGMRGGGGVIKIYTRKTPLTVTARTRRDSYVNQTPPMGYSTPKEYYEPKYRSFQSETYQKYGTIDWRPNIHIPRRGSYDLVIKHKDIDALTFFIEGISKDGSLISEKRTVQIR